MSSREGSDGRCVRSDRGPGREDGPAGTACSSGLYDGHQLTSHSAPAVDPVVPAPPTLSLPRFRPAVIIDEDGRKDRGAVVLRPCGHVGTRRSCACGSRHGRSSPGSSPSTARSAGSSAPPIRVRSAARRATSSRTTSRGTRIGWQRACELGCPLRGVHPVGASRGEESRQGDALPWRGNHENEGRRGRRGWAVPRESPYPGTADGRRQRLARHRMPPCRRSGSGSSSARRRPQAAAWCSPNPPRRTSSRRPWERPDGGFPDVPARR